MKTPWHLWIIGLVLLVLTGGGAYDFIMTQSKNAAYLTRFSEFELAYFHATPPWVIACWTLSVWGSLLAAVLLLMRCKLTVSVFFVSFVTMAMSLVYFFGLAELKVHHVFGPQIIWLSVVIMAYKSLGFIYSVWMSRSAVLR